MVDTSLALHWFMHTPHPAVGLAATVKVRGCGPSRPITTPQPVPSAETRVLRVGLIAGPEATRDLAGAQVIEYLRKDQSLEIDHAWDGVELGRDDPADYDCLVLLGWPAASSREQIKRIELFCRCGGSLVALRAMHAEIPGWPNFAEEVLGGRQPAYRRCRLLEVQRSDGAWHHPVVENVEPMIAEGEVYDGPRFSPDTTVLLTADSGQRVHPVAWTTRHEGGRVFCTTLGLDDDFLEPSFLRLISNAVHWTGLVHYGFPSG
ncbi:MAG: ThuA domain-containing protein [Planctomycetota bacterium]